MKEKKRVLWDEKRGIWYTLEDQGRPPGGSDIWGVTTEWAWINQAARQESIPGREDCCAGKGAEARNSWEQSQNRKRKGWGKQRGRLVSREIREASWDCAVTHAVWDSGFSSKCDGTQLDIWSAIVTGSNVHLISLWETGWGRSRTGMGGTSQETSSDETLWRLRLATGIQIAGWAPNANPSLLLGIRFCWNTPPPTSPHPRATRVCIVCAAFTL